jgi:hypothetical protein
MRAQNIVRGVFQGWLCWATQANGRPKWQTRQNGRRSSRNSSTNPAVCRSASRECSILPSCHRYASAVPSVSSRFPAPALESDPNQHKRDKMLRRITTLLLLLLLRSPSYPPQ